METQENKYRKEGPQLKKGDKVYLYIKNLKTKRLNKKFDYLKVGPFLIKNVKGPVNYKFQLPQEAKIYPVFYVLLLEKAGDNELVAMDFGYEPEEDNVYKIKRILDQKENQYLIK